MKAGDIILKRGKSPVSKIIQWWTHSCWSHAAIAVGTDYFVEATWPKVHTNELKAFAKYEYVLLRFKNSLTWEEYTMLVRFLGNRLGKKYDWRGLLSFLFRKSFQKKSYYFCSELVKEAMDYIGRPLIRKPPYWTTPQDLYQSLELEISEEHNV